MAISFQALDFLGVLYGPMRLVKAIVGSLTG